MRFLPRIPLPRYWRLLARYLRPLAALAGLVGVLLFVGVGFQLAVPLLAGRFISLLVDGRPPLQTLLELALAICVAGILNQVCTMTGGHLGAHVSWIATNQLREDLTEHALSLDVAYHGEHGAGEMIERIDGDARELTNFFAAFAIKLTINLLVIVGVFGVVTWIDWRIGLAYLAFCLMAMGVFSKVRGLAAPYWRQSRESVADLYGDALEWFEGLPDLRANGADGYVRRRFAEGIRRQFLRTRAATNVSLGISHVSSMILVLGSTAILALAVVLYQAGSLDIGAVVALLMYMRIINAPLEDIVQEIADLQRATASIDRIDELFAAAPALTSGPGVTIPAGALPVAFEDVTFTYPGADAGRPALRDVSFALRPGEVLGLMGHTGSGKTTLSRLLLRFYDPTAGRVRLAGHDLRDATLDQVGRHVGMVNQDVHLFRATVRDNLTMYADGTADDGLLAVLRELGLGGWYDRLDAGLDTVLAAAGGMSAGEAQLLSVARIFIADPGLVILDEPTSRLDPASEEVVQRAFGRLLAGRTGIIVAHRLSTLDRADTIMVLRHGEVAEYGPRAALAADPDGAYHRALRLAETGPWTTTAERSPVW